MRDERDAEAGLIVSASVDSGLGSRGSSPAQVTVLYWAIAFNIRTTPPPPPPASPLVEE